ncbi:hypothetical protein [Pseudosporangium ferrugineum]|uniref:Uncharacterized protein n=1 Tax=Pseudosporangium ferrugineum TaxID=439699 RepID=A0A2T0SDS4_9ACTN|nr:hypothetical protein [Pseudosporangium ferrugineum]PRY31541.1 hypothetical protein CLV70_103429 [Pseudosporangium ferrugineum]
MTAGPQEKAFTNVADGQANVGFQAQEVHIEGGYHVSDEDPPERQFEVGRRYLEISAPPEARELIMKAVARGYRNSRAYFYLALALLSGRTVQSLTDQELARLAHVRRWAAEHSEDPWARGINAVSSLLDSLPQTTAESPDPAAIGVVVKEFESLNPPLQESILNHLEVFLAGPHQDWTWQKTFATARRDRTANDRAERVWKFFQPKPAHPREVPPPPIRLGAKDYLRALGGSALLLVTGLVVIRYAWAHAWLRSAGYLLAVLGAATVAVRTGFTIRLARHRRRMARQRLTFTPRRTPAQSDRFASGMDRLFDRYFGRYLPSGAARETWLAETAGIRQTLRNELVELYREQGVEAKHVAWLVRFLASDVKRQWLSGELTAEPRSCRVSPSTRIAYGSAVFTVAVAGPLLLWQALVEAPFTTVIATVGVVVGTRLAIRGWLAILLEGHRHRDDLIRARRDFEDRRSAYDRWVRKLASKPTDAEMAHWLDCDRKVLVEDALRQYRLAAQDVIAHAFIEAPVPRCKRARVRKGPWRYSQYKLLLFLLTKDGVRQVKVTLDFETMEFGDQQRLTYQYNSVVAANVVDARSGEKKLSLTLTNNPRDELTITGEWPGMPEFGDDDRIAYRVSLDASGLERTLHVLEGIAAEGKEWITHEHRRERAGLRRLVAAMDD